MDGLRGAIQVAYWDFYYSGGVVADGLRHQTELCEFFREVGRMLHPTARDRFVYGNRTSRYHDPDPMTDREMMDAFKVRYAWEVLPRGRAFIVDPPQPT